MKRFEFKNKLKELKKNNIAFIGHMGSGKSLIGKILAENYEIQHIDSDQEIIKFSNKSINQIFEEKGEEYFRKIELKILLNLIEKENVIISLGGGSILSKQIRDKLKEKSITVFLDVNLEKLQQRLEKSDNRPLLKNINISKKIKELDTERRKYYLLADIRLENNNITPLKTCKNFIKKFLNFHEKKNTDKN